MMAEQIAHGDPPRRHRIMQTKFRDVVAHRPAPVQQPLVDQQGQSRGREGFRDRADHELGVGGNRQTSFDVALAECLEQRHLAVLHDRDGQARDLPLAHRLDDEGFELRNEVGNEVL